MSCTILFISPNDFEVLSEKGMFLFESFLFIEKSSDRISKNLEQDISLSSRQSIN